MEQKVETLDVSGEIVCLFEETDPVMTRELVNLLLKKEQRWQLSFLEMRERVTDMCSEAAAWMSGKMESFSTKRFMDAGRKAGDGAGNCTREKRRD